MESLIEFLKVVQDPTRLKILRFLMETEMCVCELVEVLDMAQPAVSQHLARLRLLKLVKERREGQWIFYSVDEKGLLARTGELQRFLCTPLDELLDLASEHERFRQLGASEVVKRCKAPR